MPPMPSGIDQQSWVQYGSFGLIVFAVTVLIPVGFYIIWVVLNRMLETHKEALAEKDKLHKESIKELTDQFTKAEQECREERVDSANKDREVRHALNNSLQGLKGVIELLLERIRDRKF
jgi:hypothetical protein